VRGESYTPEGGELDIASNTSRQYTPTSSQLFVDGVEIEFDAYLIDGNNYFRLREMGELLDFNVYWDSETLTVIVHTYN
jgi:hypothetical protein